MIKLNDDLLQELGLNSLPLEEKKRMLAHIYETLEMRVGMKLAQQMTDQQLDEFEQFIKNNDEAGALHWLETKFPHYKDVVSAEFETLKVEIRQVAPQILTSSQSQLAAMPPQVQQGQQPMHQAPAFGAPPAQPQAHQSWQQPQPTHVPQSQPSMPSQQPQQSGWQPQQPPVLQGGYSYAQPTASMPQSQLQPQYGAPAPQQPQSFSQPHTPAAGQPQPYQQPSQGSAPHQQTPNPWQPQQDDQQQQPPMAA